MLLTPELAATVKGKSVLVVDDEDAIRAILVTIFRACGANIVEANNGRSAFKIVQEQPVDLIVSDIRMPDGDGIEFLTEVRGRHGKCPPFIFITGFSEFTAEMAMERGAQAMLAKPFGTKDLIQTAATAIQVAGCPSCA